jgi:hypothetical protein
MPSEDNVENGENRPLLADTDLQTSAPTPLPKFQLFVTYLIQLAEPITGTFIYPFAPQLVQSTGITRGDESKTGYYVGLIVSLEFLLYY